MNEHDSILALIPGYPELRTPERQRVDQHAQSCDECAVALQRQHRLRSQLADAPRVVPDPAAVEACAPQSGARRHLQPDLSRVAESGGRRVVATSGNADDHLGQHTMTNLAFRQGNMER